MHDAAPQRKDRKDSGKLPYTLVFVLPHFAKLHLTRLVYHVTLMVLLQN
jgi:hypothetical protein